MFFVTNIPSRLALPWPIDFAFSYGITPGTLPDLRAPRPSILHHLSTEKRFGRIAEGGGLQNSGRKKSAEVAESSGQYISARPVFLHPNLSSSRRESPWDGVVFSSRTTSRLSSGH